MSILDDILDMALKKATSIQKQGTQHIISTFKTFLSEAKEDQTEFVKENAETLESWIVALAQKKLTSDEFKHLVAAQKRTAEQHVNTTAIESKARVKRLTLDLIEIAVKQLLPKIVKF